MPLSSGPKKAAATSTYSVTATRAGTSGRLSQLIERRAQNGAHQRFDPTQRPAVSERLIERAVNRQLVVLRARDHIAKKRRVGGRVIVAFDLLPDPVGLELARISLRPLSAISI